ncbi:MAG: amidohydrolase family protein, partial [Deltaproteobacteria bacterium]|nr:amidohydrolase family protein [Deltaproteobacteria bacterium]
IMPYYKDYKRILELFDRYGEDKSIRLGWVKIFVDGSIGARTAYLKESYFDRASRGKLLITEERLISIISELEKKGLKISMHAIGDEAIEAAVNSFEKANITLKGHRIEHAELINHDQVKRLNEMGITLCVQPNFNVVFMETYQKALGDERASNINPIKMLDEMNADIIFGSDMMPFDPEVGLSYASGILGNEKALFYYGGWRN